MCYSSAFTGLLSKSYDNPLLLYPGNVENAPLKTNENGEMELVFTLRIRVENLRFKCEVCASLVWICLNVIFDQLLGVKSIDAR